MSATTLPGKDDAKTAEKGSQTDWVAIKNEADVEAALQEAYSAREQAYRAEAENEDLRRQNRMLEQDFVKVQGELAAMKARGKARGQMEQEEKVVRQAEKVEGDTSDEWQSARPKMGGETRRVRPHSWNSDDSTSRELMGTDRGNGDFLQ